MFLRVLPRPNAWIVLAATAIVLAGCATSSRAPVVDRRPPARPPVQAPNVAMAGGKVEYHTVRKGDTLYSIALEYGQDYKDVAAWNNLDNPNVIRVGQQLRVAPPGDAPQPNDVAIAKPIAAPPVVEAHALGGAPPAKPAASENLKGEPKGGKVRYSEAALAQAQKADEPVSDAVPVPATAKEAKLEPRPEARPEPKLAEPVAADEVVDWTWPYTGKMLSGFSEGANKGIDIAGKSGDAVVAAAEGRVLYVGNNIRGYGNLVIVKHNPAFLSAYAHNSKILVKENQHVKKGQKIAELGASDADQPKLHFEIRRQGKPVDPVKFLPAR